MPDNKIEITIDMCQAYRANFNNQLLSMERQVNTQLNSLKEATTLAKFEMDKRLEGMNEFRNQLKDQSSTFAKGESLAAYIVSAGEEIKNIRLSMEKVNGDLRTLENSFNTANVGLEKRLEAMNEFRSQLKDQASGFFTRNEHDQFSKRIEEDIRSLRESRAQLEGKASQNSVNIAYVIAGVSMIISLILHFW
jgi:hypothetical protein